MASLEKIPFNGNFIRYGPFFYVFFTDDSKEIHIPFTHPVIHYTSGQKVKIRKIEENKYRIVDSSSAPAASAWPSSASTSAASAWAGDDSTSFFPAPSSSKKSSTSKKPSVYSTDTPGSSSSGAAWAGDKSSRASLANVFSVRDTSFDLFLRNEGIYQVENLLRHADRTSRNVKRDNARGFEYVHGQSYRIPNIVDTAINYCQRTGMGPQLKYMDDLLQDTENDAHKGLKAYVRSAYSISGHLDRGVAAADYRSQVTIAAIDSIFSSIPPLTEPITVFRKWGKSYKELDDVRDSPVDTNLSNPRFLSTSLTLAIPNEQTFHGDDAPQYARIDIMPGVSVLPLLNWEEWSHYQAHCLSQCEILLPRDARLHKIVGSTMPEFRWGRDVEAPMAVGIVSSSNINGTPYQLPRITHHFIVSPIGLGKFKIRLPNGLEKDDQTGGKLYTMKLRKTKRKKRKKNTKRKLIYSHSIAM